MVIPSSHFTVRTTRFKIHMFHQYVPIQRPTSHRHPALWPLTRLWYAVFRQAVFIRKVSSPNDRVFRQGFGATVGRIWAPDDVVRWVLWWWILRLGHPGIEFEVECGLRGGGVSGRPLGGIPAIDMRRRQPPGNPLVVPRNFY